MNADHHRRILLFIVVSGLLMAADTFATSTVPFRFTGQAEHQGQVLYLEHHEVRGQCVQGRWRPALHHVSYRKPGKEAPFARKTLDYSRSLQQPSLLFYQQNARQRLKIDVAGTDLLRIELDNQSKEPRSYEIQVDERVVIDAGFNHLVRNHWNQVIAGNPLSFRFLSPDRGEHYGFEILPGEAGRVAAYHQLAIRPTALLTRLLVAPILLGYDRNGFLTDYVGLTNIRKDEDSNYTAHIRYRHDGLPDCPLV